MNVEKLLWSTRGREWGFRLLREPQFDVAANWQAARDSIFRSSTNDADFFARGVQSLRSGYRAAFVAARFHDPESRRDAAGRVIPHEVIFFEPDSRDSPPAATAAEFQERVWPLLKDAYGQLYGLSVEEVRGHQVVVNNSDLVVQLVQPGRPSQLLDRAARDFPSVSTATSPDAGGGHWLRPDRVPIH